MADVVKVLLPLDTHAGLPNDPRTGTPHWWRTMAGIEAEYTVQELACALACAGKETRALELLIMEV